MTIATLAEQLETVLDIYARKYEIDRSPDWFVLKLMEEAGELVQSYLKYSGQARSNNENERELKQAFADEVADVIGMALLVAKNNGIDIEAAVERKWLKYLE